MQIHIRGQQTHVLEVQPSETIETVKVSHRSSDGILQLVLWSWWNNRDPRTVCDRNKCPSFWRFWLISWSMSLERWPHSSFWNLPDSMENSRRFHRGTSADFSKSSFAFCLTIDSPKYCQIKLFWSMRTFPITFGCVLKVNSNIFIVNSSSERWRRQLTSI